MVAIVRTVLVAGFIAATGVASAADYSRYRVTGTTTLDLMAGPSNTAALLSPDGSRLLHVGASEICLLAPADTAPWKTIGCTEKTPDHALRAPEDALWSPRGDRMLMPTYVEALLMFRDTDIRVFDPQAMTVANLTDDGFDDSLFDRPRPADFDLAARWLDDDTIAFLRYEITEDGVGKGAPPRLMTIEAAGGEPSALATIEGAERVLAYTLATSADGRRIAYSMDDRDNSDAAGIYLIELETRAVRRIAAVADIGKPLVGMAFSADGSFLLLLGPHGSHAGVDARVLDLATGKVVAVDAGRNVTGVAWSPTGSALAYVSFDRDDAAGPGGLFLAARPGEPGRLLLKGAFMPPVCCGNLPFTWASNDTMVVGNVEKPDAPVYVRLGE